MELINDLQVSKQSEEDLQAVLQIAFVSAYRCPASTEASPSVQEEFQLAWSAPQSA
ncbi:hypothetical protein [Nonomuraea sp. PA05]|uniref:hypothetical protein n=1 Tax=Nonomuraea sp. PA05 TaxID=2604466 RepID=UPI00165249AA|nr:hypothetical protein [Nonomuraea sp. PA05]